MFVLNAVGIILAGMVMFSLMNIYSKKKVVTSSLREVEQEQKELKEKIEKEKKNS